MKIEKRILITVVVASVAILSGAVRADWVPEDGHKMHFPQLPDPNGWDVNITADNMWDDWKCTQTGPVDDIHFWASWRGDQAAPQPADPGQFLWIRVQIYADMPAGPSAENPLPYSHPVGQPLWEQYFSNTEDPSGPKGPLPDFTMRHAGQGQQGWFDPHPVGAPPQPVVIPNDHVNYYQVNFTDIPNPFPQEEGTIYWLAIHAAPINLQHELGWKTADLSAYPEPYTDEHYQDDAVFYYGGWGELIDPNDGLTSMDLAFVITPEPVTVLVLALGLLPILLLKRHRRATV